MNIQSDVDQNAVYFDFVNNHEKLHNYSKSYRKEQSINVIQQSSSDCHNFRAVLIIGMHKFCILMFSM